MCGGGWWLEPSFTPLKAGPGIAGHLAGDRCSPGEEGEVGQVRGSPRANDRSPQALRNGGPRLRANL